MTERLMSHVYPILAGDDLRSLTYLFSLLEDVPDKLNGLTPQDHLALLKKCKSITPGLFATYINPFSEAMKFTFLFSYYILGIYH